MNDIDPDLATHPGHMKRIARLVVLPALVAAALLGPIIGQAADQTGLLKSEFIYETAPFASCHASTIEETRDGLVAAWFGGTGEGQADVGIWVSRHRDGHWTTPVEVANGIESADKRYPTWNPVLFMPRTGPLMLFYKVGPNPPTWWGMLITSDDGGETWSPPRPLPEGILGPTKNKPVQLANGDLLSPTSTEGEAGWRVHFERSSDLGQTWTATQPLNDGEAIAAIQPSILFHRRGRLQALGRTRQGRIFDIWSRDHGKTWSRMTLTALPNPSSGTDAVTLKDGRQLLVYNHSTNGRSPLNVAVSSDGRRWSAALVLEDDPAALSGFSYPAVLQATDGLVHITYTWKRQRIKHAVVDPAVLTLREMKDKTLLWPN